MRIMIRIIVYAAVAYGVLRWFEWSQLYIPSRDVYATPDSAGLAYEDVTLVTEDDRRVHAWWIPHPKARGTVIVCHGNAGTIADRIWIAADLHIFRVNVLLFDYRGYGKSSGFPTERGTYRDARAAYEFARLKHGESDDPPIIVYGRSLGGAVAAHLASTVPVRGVVLESAFTSVPDMARRLYPFLPLRWLVHFRYDTIGRIGEIDAPILIAHSVDDEMIASENGRLLYEAANEPKLFVELSGGHNDSGWNRTPAYWKAWKEWLGGIFGPASGPNEETVRDPPPGSGSSHGKGDRA
jgi:uncharacterized protein